MGHNLCRSHFGDAHVPLILMFIRGTFGFDPQPHVKNPQVWSVVVARPEVGVLGHPPALGQLLILSGRPTPKWHPGDRGATGLWVKINPPGDRKF